MFNGDLTSHHDKYMREALKLAETAFFKDEVPVGAVVVYNNRIIGRGYNQVEMLCDPTAHAEMLALSAACTTLHEKYLSHCTLYVTLEPCMMCTGAIVWSKLARVVFGAMDVKAGSCGTVFNLAANKKLNHQTEIIQGILEQECSDILKRFFRSKRT